MSNKQNNEYKEGMEEMECFQCDEHLKRCDKHHRNIKIQALDEYLIKKMEQEYENIPPEGYREKREEWFFISGYNKACEDIYKKINPSDLKKDIEKKI